MPVLVFGAMTFSTVTISIMTFSKVAASITIKMVCAESRKLAHYAVPSQTECRYVRDHYVERRQAERRCRECRGALALALSAESSSNERIQKMEKRRGKNGAATFRQLALSSTGTNLYPGKLISGEGVGDMLSHPYGCVC
jgi:hypothetical protein